MVAVYPPCEALRPYVRSFAFQETTTAATHKVLPDTSIVMGFQYKGHLSILKQPRPSAAHPLSKISPLIPASEAYPLAPSGITGLQDTYRLFHSAPQTGTLLVRFTTTGAVHFFTAPMHELFNGSYSLTDLSLSSEITLVEEQLAGARTETQRIAVIEQWLLNRLLHRKEDLLVQSAIARIHACKGQLRISELGQELYISPSRLEKRFRAVVGASPKKFAGLVRLRQILQVTPGKKDLTALAYEAGYFDQAHFIHDFTACTGTTPAEFFRLPA